RFGNGIDKQLGTGEQRSLQAGDTFKSNAARQSTRCIDRNVSFTEIAPTAGRIEVFEGQTDGVHQLMTSRACRIGPVLRHALAHRKNLAYRIVVSQRRHVRRWWWWRRAENIFENPFPALNRRSAVCIG